MGKNRLSNSMKTIVNSWRRNKLHEKIYHFNENEILDKSLMNQLVDTFFTETFFMETSPKFIGSLFDKKVISG